MLVMFRTVLNSTLILSKNLTYSKYQFLHRSYCKTIFSIITHATGKLQLNSQILYSKVLKCKQSNPSVTLPVLRQLEKSTSISANVVGFFKHLFIYLVKDQTAITETQSPIS